MRLIGELETPGQFPFRFSPMNQMTIRETGPRDGDSLVPLVYSELKRIASAKLRRESPENSMHTTALVHEAYARLHHRSSQQLWRSESDFFAAAAEAMRRILVDHARRRLSEKRGKDWNRVQDPDAVKFLPSGDDDQRVLAVHAALDRLEEIHPRQAALVKLRFFAGMTLEEAAEAQQISVPTAKRDWASARVWIYRYLRDD